MGIWCAEAFPWDALTISCRPSLPPMSSQFNPAAAQITNTGPNNPLGQPSIARYFQKIELVLLIHYKKVTLLLISEALLQRKAVKKNRKNSSALTFRSSFKQKNVDQGLKKSLAFLVYHRKENFAMLLPLFFTSCLSFSLSSYFTLEHHS